MRRSVLVAVLALAAAAVLAPSGTAAGLGPPGGTIYAFDTAFRTIATPGSLPNTGPFDTLYVFPDCPACAAVSASAPGRPGYFGGRWEVIEAHGITTQLTNAAAVLASATALVDTGVRFVCPLIR